MADSTGKQNQDTREPKQETDRGTMAGQGQNRPGREQIVKELSGSDASSGKQIRKEFSGEGQSSQSEHDEFDGTDEAEWRRPA